MTPPKVTDEGREGKYFHVMVNMADDDLDPYQYRLFGHYKRVCGESEDGACWESTRTTAEKCKMSVGKVASVRRELVDMGYVEITAGSREQTLAVTLKDLMPANIQRYASRSQGEQAVHKVNTTVQDMNTDVHTVNVGVHEVKQRRTIEEQPIEKDKGRNAPAREVTPAQVTFIQEHPVWLAFVKGWDGITPALEAKTVDDTLTAIQVLYADIGKGETSHEEIEAVTRWKLQQPRSQTYRLEYVKADTAAFRVAQRTQAAANGKRASPAPPILTPTSQGVPLSLARREKDRARENERTS